MPDSNEVGVPGGGFGALISGDGRVAVASVERSVGNVRDERQFHPGCELAGGGVPTFNLVVELRAAGGIAGEDEIVTVGTGYVSAIGDRGKSRIGHTNQDREIRLIR